MQTFKFKIVIKNLVFFVKKTLQTFLCFIDLSFVQILQSTQKMETENMFVTGTPIQMFFVCKCITILGYGTLSGKMLLVRIVKNNKIDAHFR